MIIDVHSVSERYGRTPEDRQETIQYVKALKYIIGADGEVAAAEWDSLRKGMLQLNIPPDIVEEIEEFDVAKAKLEDILPDLKNQRRKAHLLIRDAIEISRADGTYAQEEKEAVRKAAELLHVDHEVVGLLETLVVMEHGLRHMRKTLLGTKA